MWNSLNSGSPSSDLAKGKNFLEKLQYVQHVDKRKNKASEISELILLKDLLADRKVCHDSNSTENLANSESNLDILKSSLKERIHGVYVCSNPLPIPIIGSSSRVTFHAFVVFATHNATNSEKEMWWSLEKNGKYIVLQQSENEDDVAKKLYDAEKGQSVKQHGEVKEKKLAMGNFKPLRDLLQIIWENNQIIDPYHLLYSNCQNFASFIFENLNGERKNWSTNLSAAVDLLRGKNKKTAIELNIVMNQLIVNDDKFDCYWAMMDERRKDFEELINNLTMETLNSVDSQGYTLLEWATVFSTSDWPIDEELKEKGAAIRSDKGLFRRNVFFIALQYLPPNKKSQLFKSFDEIDIHGVNGTGDTALHLALYGEKWEPAGAILNQLKDYEVNLTNSLGDTPLHLAAKLKNCKKGLFKKILNRTNSENVNKVNGNGWTALHYAIDQKSEIKVEELLNHKDVDVSVQNNEDYYTALHLASMWPNIPADLFQMILEKSTSDTINTQDKDGRTALHWAIFYKSKTAVKELLNHKDVNVANNENGLALHLACIFENFPMDLFNLILEKTVDVNAQTNDDDGDTALHLAIRKKSETATKALLSHKDVDVNVKRNSNTTVLHSASMYWTYIPMDLFKTILKRSTNINEQDKEGDTALHYAIDNESKTKVKKLLEDDRVDVNVKTNQNFTPLHLACWWKDIPSDLFKLILEKSTDINAQDDEGWTALHIACLRNFQEAITALLEDDRVDVNVKNDDNRKALYYSLEREDVPMDLFKLIIKKSTDINEQDKDGWTALHFVIIGESKTKVEELLAHTDVDVNIKGKFNLTPLHLASMWKDIPVDLFKLILQKSTDVNAQDIDGDTALHYAIFRESEIATKALLAHNDVDANVRNVYNETTLHLASNCPNMPIQLFKIILEKSIDINAQDNDGHTALHCAILHQSKTHVEELLKHKDVNVNVKNNYNETALHWAFHYWEDIPMDLYKIILENTVDINAQTKDGDTAFHIAFI